MPLTGLRLGHVSIQGMNEFHFGLRWHRLLFPTDGLPALHLGPVMYGNFVPASEGSRVWTLHFPHDPATPAPAAQDLGGLDPAIMASPANAHDSGGSPADLESILAAMASGAAPEAPSEPGGGDLGGAFLPAHGGDLPHILGLGLVFTPPLLPPPDMI